MACFRVRRGVSSFDIDAFFSHRSVFVISWTVLVCRFFFGSLASRFFLLSVAKHAKLAPLSGWWLASLLDHCLRVASRSFPHSLLRYFCCFEQKKVSSYNSVEFVSDATKEGGAGGAEPARAQRGPGRGPPHGLADAVEHAVASRVGVGSDSGTTRTCILFSVYLGITPRGTPKKKN